MPKLKNAICFFDDWENSTLHRITDEQFLYILEKYIKNLHFDKSKKKIFLKFVYKKLLNHYYVQQ